MFERKNIYITFTTSLLIHAMLGLFYMRVTQVKKESTLFLENIEFIEIEADVEVPQEIYVPAQVLPKSVLDFVKMALPIFKKPKLQEITVPEEIDKKELMEPQEKIDLKSNLKIQAKPKISITDKKHKLAADFAEIVPDLGKSTRKELEIPGDIAIDISEVGKVAVRETAIQAIDLDKRVVSARLKDIKEIEIKKTERKSHTPQIMQKAVVSIKKRKYTAVKPSIGYGKGISLRKVAKKRKVIDQIKISEPVVRKAEQTTSGKIIEAKPDKKSVDIVGPIVGRKIIKSYLPVYPDWAKARNIEADVAVRFYVSPDGRVREKLYLERTSGYSKLDKLVMEAIRKWVFEPVSAGDQWGIITIRYLLE